MPPSPSYRTSHAARRARPAALLAAFALAIAALGCTPSFPGTAGSPGSGPGPAAPELVGLTDWTNSEPLTLAALQAQRRVVLIDFWTYTCVNCIRTLPYLQQWHERYAAQGLTIIGVHSPEFEFEKETANVRRAIAANGITYPVALDNRMATWSAFHNNAWPAKYLVSVDGRIRYTYFGEGDYAATEQAIRQALTDAGRDLAGVPPTGLGEPRRDGTSRTITRELYAGYARNLGGSGGYAAQKEYYAGPDRTVEYTDTPRKHDRDVWYLQGAWRNEREAIVHARETQNLEDYFVFRFAARSANVVMRPRTPGAAFEVVVELDGRPMRPDEAGPDVRFDAAGRSVITVQEPRMYRVAILPALGDHELRLRSNSAEFSVYAVTFGAYMSGS